MAASLEDEQPICAQLVGELPAALGELLRAAGVRLVERGAEALIGDPVLLEPLAPALVPLIGYLVNGEGPARFLDAAVRDPRDLPVLLRALVGSRRARDELARRTDRELSQLPRVEGAQSGRAILSFREETEGRRLEAELRQTKEFLERLIDATLDGIVASDLHGKILLFNKGAERVTGYSASEVVGQMNVLRLYPPGPAMQMMAKLRSSSEARLVRTELIARGGELVPVSLSAALVREGGCETATVCVFSDLRDRLRVEAELQETQAKLQIAEKAALVSELAGAAAHELNQPLTSVLGFSELLFRRAGQDDSGREELGAILREAERMATIVRKIGKIARYETTEYLGNKRIVDLDRASEPPKPKG